MDKDKLLLEAQNILLDLQRCGAFHISAIELNFYVENRVDGEEFEERIDAFLKKSILK